MNPLLHRRETGTSATSVLVFPRLVEDPQETDALSAPEEVSGEFVDQLRAAFDTLLTQTYIKHVRLAGGPPESPFDAVYISALEPDEIDHSAIALLDAHQDLKDLSDTIQFADEWGD